MDRESVSTTMRARKVTYDEYTGGFYVESRVEALERQVATRAKMTDVLNRSQETKLKLKKKQAKSAHDIFERKLEKEEHQHKEMLKDQLAHYGVLQELARDREVTLAEREDSHLGTYGPGTSKTDIQPLITKKIKDSTPSAKRKKQSKKILANRRNVKLFDRTRTTSGLLRMRDQITSRPTSKQQDNQEGGGASPRLILPPITVHWARRQLEKAGEKPGQRIEQASQSNIFITDSRF